MAPRTSSAYDPAAAPAAEGTIVNTRTRTTADIVNAGLKSRYRAEKRFRMYGVIAIAAALLMVAALFISIVSKGYSAFVITSISLPVTVERDLVADSNGEVTEKSIAFANFNTPLRNALLAQFPEVTTRSERRALYGILSDGASFKLQRMIEENPDLIGREIMLTSPVSSDYDVLNKGGIDLSVPENMRRSAMPKPAGSKLLKTEA